MCRSGFVVGVLLLAAAAAASEPLTPEAAKVVQRGVVDLLSREGFAATVGGVTLGEKWVRPRGKLEVAWVFAAAPIEVRGRAVVATAAPEGPTFLSGEIEELNQAARASLAKRARARSTKADADAAARQEQEEAEKKAMFEALQPDVVQHGVLTSAPPALPKSIPRGDLRLPNAMPSTQDAGQH